MSDSAAAAAASVATPSEELVTGELDGLDDDADIEELRAKVRAMEEEQLEEAKRMGELSGAGAAQANNATAAGPTMAPSKSILTPEQQSEQDSRSIHVAQVDYTVTEDELKQLFEACGPVNRATILKDRFTGQPKGFGYVEFQSADAIANAMILNETEFKGRTLKITPKRTNIPGFNRGGRGGRGRGRGGPRGGFAGGYEDASGGAGGGYGPVRGRGGRGGRGRGAPRGGYHPYQY